MQKSLTQLVEEMARIRRAEQTVEARIAKVDYTICNLRTKKYQIHQELKRLRDSRDRKSTRLNSSHITSSYAVFCLKKKNKAKREMKQTAKNTRSIVDGRRKE